MIPSFTDSISQCVKRRIFLCVGILHIFFVRNLFRCHIILFKRFWVSWKTIFFKIFIYTVCFPLFVDLIQNLIPKLIKRGTCLCVGILNTIFLRNYFWSLIMLRYISKCPFTQLVSPFYRIWHPICKKRNLPICWDFQDVFCWVLLLDLGECYLKRSQWCESQYLPKSSFTQFFLPFLQNLWKGKPTSGSKFQILFLF